MTPYLQALMSRKQEAEARLKETQIAAAEAAADLKDAQEWLAIPKAARKRARDADPADVIAFAALHFHGKNEPKWRERGWRKQKVDRSRWHTAYYNGDTPTGTAVRILHRRGAEWCDQLEQP